jgi:hypothetical protein
MRINSQSRSIVFKKNASKSKRATVLCLLLQLLRLKMRAGTHFRRHRRHHRASGLRQRSSMCMRAHCTCNKQNTNASKGLSEATHASCRQVGDGIAVPQELSAIAAVYWQDVTTRGRQGGRYPRVRTPSRTPAGMGSLPATISARRSLARSVTSITAFRTRFTRGFFWAAVCASGLRSAKAAGVAAGVAAAWVLHLKILEN